MQPKQARKHELMPNCFTVLGSKA